MIGALALAVLLAQTGYVRSRVDDDDPRSQCLWWDEGTVIALRQHVDGNPENAGDTEFAAISKAVATWQAEFARCGNLTLRDGDRTTTRAVGYKPSGGNENVALFRLSKCSDKVAANHACWADDDCGNQFDCWQHANSAIAITTTSYNPETGRILDSDIEFNTPSFIFTTVDAPACVAPAFNQACVATDVQNTATHELGHLLGLGHINVSSSTMSSRANAGEISKRTLDPGSKAFVCEVYPKGAPSRPCKVVPYDGTLGKVPGCSAAPAALWPLTALGWLARRRRR